MTYSSSDIRGNIRDTIGYTKYIRGAEYSTVSVYDDYGDKVYVPMLLPDEARTGDLPPFPFIEMTLVDSPSRHLSIDGSVRDMDIYIDLNVYSVKQDGISPTTFNKKVCDEVIDRIMANMCSISSCYYVEIINDGREILEVKEGKAVVFHRVMECHVKNIS